MSGASSGGANGASACFCRRLQQLVKACGAPIRLSDDRLLVGAFVFSGEGLLVRRGSSVFRGSGASGVLTFAVFVDHITWVRPGGGVGTSVSGTGMSFLSTASSRLAAVLASAIACLVGDAGCRQRTSGSASGGGFEPVACAWSSSSRSWSVSTYFPPYLWWSSAVIH